MSTTSKTAERGSAKLFAIELHDHKALASAIGAAHDEYQIKWWWQYGKPAIDRIDLTLEIGAKQFGSVLGSLMHLNGPEVQVTARCFPNGLPYPDSFRVGVEMLKNPGKGV